MNIFNRSAASLLPVILFLSISLLPAPALSEAEQSYPFQDLMPGEKLLPLSLRQSLCTAVSNSLAIQLQEYPLRISASDILVQQGIFDPYLYFNATYADATIPLPSDISVSTGGLTSIEAKQWSLTGGLAGAIISGLTYDANISSVNTPSSTITEAFGTNGQEQLQTTLTLSQPLLRNFGVDVSTTGIRAAEKTREASMFQLEQSVNDTLFAVEEAYWNLVFTYETLRVAMNSLNVARNLLRENEARLKVGVVAPLDVIQSETGVAFREEEVIIAQRRVKEASDVLISRMNLFPGQNNWDVLIMPTDAAAAGPPAQMDEQAQIALGLTNRPELWALIKQREAAELQVKYTKNQLLPTLNLNASIGLVGLDSDFNSSIFSTTPVPPFPHTGVDPAADDLFSGDNIQWTVGFTFEVPWGEHFERGQYRVANLQVGQLEASIQNLRLAIAQDVRNALRQIRTNWDRVNTTHLNTEFRRRSLDAERRRYEVGTATTFDLLQYENELARAQASEFSAIVDYRISLANLLRATGALIAYDKVSLPLVP